MNKEGYLLLRVKPKAMHPPRGGTLKSVAHMLMQKFVLRGHFQTLFEGVISKMYRQKCDRGV